MTVKSRVEVNRVIQPTETAEGADSDKLTCAGGGNGNGNGNGNRNRNTKTCITGGILVWDSFFGPLSDPGRFVDELIAFAIRQDEEPVAYERLSYVVCNDGIDRNRDIKIKINPVFVPEYGYTIHESYNEETITLRNNEDLGGTPCPGRVVVTPLELDVEENTTKTYTVELSSRPKHDVNIQITIEGDMDVTLPNNNGMNMPTLTFPHNDWATPQPVAVNAAEDEDGVDDTATITHLATSTDSDYEGMIVYVKVTVDDTDNSPATGKPTISGNPRVGQRLTANTGGISDLDGPPSPTFSYQWQRDGTDILNADKRTYRLSDADGGRRITVEVTFTDSRGNDEILVSDPTGPVSPRPPPNTATFTPTPTNTPTPTQSNSGGGGGAEAEAEAAHNRYSTRSPHHLLPHRHASRRTRVAAVRAKATQAAVGEDPVAAVATPDVARRTSRVLPAIRASSRIWPACSGWCLSSRPHRLLRQQPRSCRYPRWC